MMDAITQYDEESRTNTLPSEQKKLFGVLSSNVKKAFTAKVSDEKFLMIIVRICILSTRRMEFTY